MPGLIQYRIQQVIPSARSLNRDHSCSPSSTLPAGQSPSPDSPQPATRARKADGLLFADVARSRRRRGNPPGTKRHPSGPGGCFASLAISTSLRRHFVRDLRLRSARNLHRWTHRPSAPKFATQGRKSTPAQGGGSSHANQGDGHRQETVTAAVSWERFTDDAW